MRSRRPRAILGEGPGTALCGSVVTDPPSTSRSPTPPTVEGALQPRPRAGGRVGPQIAVSWLLAIALTRPPARGFGTLRRVSSSVGGAGPQVCVRRCRSDATLVGACAALGDTALVAHSRGAHAPAAARAHLHCEGRLLRTVLDGGRIWIPICADSPLPSCELGLQVLLQRTMCLSWPPTSRSCSPARGPLHHPQSSLASLSARAMSLRSRGPWLSGTHSLQRAMSMPRCSPCRRHLSVSHLRAAIRQGISSCLRF